MKKQRTIITRFWLAFALAFGGAAGGAGLVSYASTAAEVEQEKQEAEAEYEKAGAAIENLEKGRADTAEAAEGLGQELTSLLVDIQLLESDMEDLESQIETASQEYAKARKQQEQRYDVMKKRIQYLYEEGDITYLDILLKAKSIGDLIRGTEYTRQLYEYDRDMILDYEEIRQDVLTRKEHLEEQQSEMETMKKEYFSQKSALEEAIEVKKAALTNFDQKLEETKRQAKEYAAVIQQKAEQIRQLKAEEEFQRQQEAWRLEQQQMEASRRQDGGEVVYKSSGGTEFGRSVADYALQFVGNPYVWGGTSLTDGADCSGFTQSVYRHFGVNIPRTSAEQANFGKEIAYEDMEPGDLICYAGHVSMYIGKGRIVHAASARAGITVTGDPAYRTIVAIRRPWQPGE